MTMSEERQHGALKRLRTSSRRKVNEIPGIQQFLLLRIIRDHPEDAYGLGVHRRYEELLGARRCSSQSTTGVMRMKDYGWIAVTEAPDAGVRHSGGRPRVFYVMTPEGEELLAYLEGLLRPRALEGGAHGKP